MQEFYIDPPTVSTLTECYPVLKKHAKAGFSNCNVDVTTREKAEKIANQLRERGYKVSNPWKVDPKYDFWTIEVWITGYAY